MNKKERNELNDSIKCACKVKSKYNLGFRGTAIRTVPGIVVQYS